MPVVHWRAEVGNWPARRVAWACGMTVEGTVRGLLARRDERVDAWVGSVRWEEPLRPRSAWLVPVPLDGDGVRLELELVGARQVKARLAGAVMIFIAPPSLSELERRLRGRGTDSESRIQKRLARAREEIRAVKEFDYVVVNDTLKTAVRDFCAIIYAERARTELLRERDVANFLREL